MYLYVGMYTCTMYCVWVGSLYSHICDTYICPYYVGVSNLHESICRSVYMFYVLCVGR